MKKIPLTQGYFALVDDENYVWLSRYNWCVSGGYAVRTLYVSKNKYTLQRMHRLILGLNYKDGKICDHINGNGLDNRQSNLRIVTSQQNSFNRKVGTGFVSAHKGVYWSSREDKWKASITIDGKFFHLGYFVDEIEAAKCYDKVSLCEFGKFAKINFQRKDYRRSDLISAQSVIDKRNSKKTSQYRGVCWDSQRHKWMTYIKHKGKNIFLGRFTSEENAAKAYNQAAKKLHKTKARLNDVK